MTGKDQYILETVRNLVRTHVDKKARIKHDKDGGVVYYLKIGKKFKRKFITLKKARRIFYDLYN